MLQASEGKGVGAGRAARAKPGGRKLQGVEFSLAAAELQRTLWPIPTGFSEEETLPRIRLEFIRAPGAKVDIELDGRPRKLAQ